jgi:predicted DNA-binding protein
MEVRFTPEIEARLDQLAAASGRAKEDFVSDAMAGYLEELAQTREMLQTRYEDFKSGRVKPIDGEEAFARLRQKSKARRKDRS